ncbi:MAG TPA: PQQ-binding-like beta-propeller repeat protein [Candidatus Acidoferrales bacterium]|nr:PQQ-binding-like beta-propeller repeat protein [Candidatus Acidoferrales bacterium]
MSKRYLRFRVSEVRSIAIIFLFLLALALFVGGAQQFGGRPLAAGPAAADDTDWTYADHDLNGTRYSPLKQITAGNVKQLAKVCSYTFPEKVPSESEPIVSAGVIYATSDHYTVALDAADCHVLWSYQWVPRATDRVHPHRGAAIANGKIIRGTGDDFLISLDAETGKLQWAQQIANPDEGHFIAMPPLVHGDLIYIGPAGSERAGTGWIGAFKLSTGEQVWKFNVIPQDGEPGADTWGPNPEARKHAGGALWTAQSYDTEKDVLYIAGGNPAPDFFDDARPGINLYTNSIIALDGKTGKLLWYNQFIPHDVDDYDITHVNPIFKVNSRTMIASSGKDGVLRVVDGETHKVIYSSPFTTQLNSEVPLTHTPMKVCPGILGGNEWNSGGFSPNLTLIVMPSNDLWCSMNMKDNEAPSVAKANTGEKSYFGGPIDHGAFSGSRGRLTGFDAATGKERWRYESPTPMVAGVAITAADLIFTGETGGFFDAVDAQTGKVLLHYDMGDSIQGGVVTYSAHNMQYVAVTSGDGNVLGNKNFPEIKGGNPTVTVFGLPKK